jgi:hypothetical protein
VVLTGLLDPRLEEEVKVGSVDVAVGQDWTVGQRGKG